MSQSAAPRPAVRSVFREGALTVEAYTRLWIKLINQSERGKQLLGEITCPR